MDEVQFGICCEVPYLLRNYASRGYQNGRSGGCLGSRRIARANGASMTAIPTSGAAFDRGSPREAVMVPLAIYKGGRFRPKSDT
jgi:hypothetical protein